MQEYRQCDAGHFLRLPAAGAGELQRWIRFLLRRVNRIFTVSGIELISRSYVLRMNQDWLGVCSCDIMCQYDPVIWKEERFGFHGFIFLEFVDILYGTTRDKNLLVNKEVMLSECWFSGEIF